MKRIAIKNMVCSRCVMVVKQELEKLGLHATQIALGEVVLNDENYTESKQQELDQALLAVGFERIDDHKAKLIEDIKNKIINLVHHTENTGRRFNWSYVLSEALHYEYNYLSTLFSTVVGITLEQYIIRQKIERVKELLFYDQLTLSEIAVQLGYSSVAHLSSQFKKVTGFTPSQLKKSRTLDTARKSIDEIIL